MNTSTLAFARLKGRENYSEWKIGVRAHLITKGLWAWISTEITVSSPATDKKSDEKCLAELTLTLDTCVYTHIEECETAKSAWDALKLAFQDTGVSRKVTLLKQWITLRLENCESMHDYVTQCLSLRSKVRNAGFSIDEQTAGAIMLCGLSDDYRPMVMSIEAKGSELTVDFVKNILLQEVEFEKSDDASAFAARQKKSFKKFTQKKDIKCFECDGPHFKRNCPKLKDGKASISLYSSFAAQNSAPSEDWYMDSGASAHMTHQKDSLVNESGPIVKEVQVANNQKLAIKSTGDVQQSIVNKESNANSCVTLKNVQYVPDICANLLSVSQMVKKGHEVLFNRVGCKIFDNCKNVIATGSLVNDMFKLDVPNSNVYSANKVTIVKPKIENVSDFELWHRRLGHVSYGNSVFVNNFEKSIRRLEVNKCETCIKGKQCRLPFSKNGSRATKLLELVHTDVCGPLPIRSNGGCRYFLTLIDDYTRKVFVYLLKSKNQAYQCFVDFKQMVENQTEQKIKTLRSDNGTEYVNVNFAKLCAKYGIIHQRTVIHTPQQNGLAERMNRTLLDRVRCMLIDSRLSKRFWAEALMTATKVINSVPCKGTGKISPHEAWSGNKPDLNEFKVFGCKAFAHVPGAKRKKLDDKAQEYVFVGYATEQKGYRLYHHESKKVMISRDVTFIETERGDKVIDLESNDINRVVVSLQEVGYDSDFESGEDDTGDSSITGSIGETVTGTHPDVNNPNTSVQLGGHTNQPVNDDDDSQDELSGVSLDFESAEEETVFDPDNESTQIDESGNLDETVIPRTKSTRIASLPKPKYTYIAFEESDPITVDEAMSGNSKEFWLKAMKEEMDSLVENKTWELSNKPNDKKAVKCKWIFKTKRNTNGDIARYKARLVAKGFTQVQGIDYDETYSPVVRYTSIRYLLAMAVKYDLKLSQMDVVTAFLHGKLDTDIYMQQPELFHDGSKRYCKLIKSIYGLKQSSRLWNTALSKVLIEFGLKQSINDQCIYYDVTSGYILIVAVYVDDLLIMSNNPTKESQLKEILNTNFKMKDLGEPTLILGIRIQRDKNTGAITIDQERYIQGIIERFGLDEANPVTTPLDLNQKISKEFCPKTEADKYEMRNVPYREATGSLLYAAQVTRPDINFAVNLLCRYNENPGKAHWVAVKRIIRYLKGTVSQRITYTKSSSDLIGYCDSDWGSDLDEHKSTTGYVFVSQGGAISWSTRKQRTPALSTTEAEYMAMTECIQEAMWLKYLNDELQPNANKSITIHCDNRGAVDLAKNNNFSNRTKHIDIKYRFISQAVRDGKVNLKQVSTQDMLADILTKAIARPKLLNFLKFFGMERSS